MTLKEALQGLTVAQRASLLLDLCRLLREAGYNRKNKMGWPEVLRLWREKMLQRKG